jgi:DNA-binding CsgD family transcriptional regulator
MSPSSIALVWNRRKYAPVPRRPLDDLDTLNTILRSQLDKLSPAQREIIEETFLEGRTRAQIVARRGMSTSTHDNHLQAAYRALRRAMMDVVKTSKGADRPSWYDLVEVLNERHAAKQLRRTSCEKGKRSTSQHERSSSQHERSSFTGEASTGAPERGTIPREGAASAVSAAISRGKGHKNAVARSAARGEARRVEGERCS